MVRPQTIEYAESAFSANPWEEEVRKRDEKKEEYDDNNEEEQEQTQPSQRNVLPERNFPAPHASAQKGILMIFGKVDGQIEQLERQIIATQAELLHARNLVTAVRSKVANLNKPEASELLEEDVFMNYLRIGDQLKAIANNICMVIPDHGRQIVRTHKSGTYSNEELEFNESDKDESDPEPLSVNTWLSHGHDEPRFYEEASFSESNFGSASSYNWKIAESSSYGSDERATVRRSRPQSARSRHSTEFSNHEKNRIRLARSSQFAYRGTPDLPKEDANFSSRTQERAAGCQTGGNPSR